MELSLLGCFAITVDGRSLAVPMVSQRILALLAIRDQPLHRQYVAGVLWPDYPEGRAVANLRTALSRLPLGGGALVTASGQRLVLSSDVAVDLRETRALIRRVLDQGDDVLGLDRVIDRLMVDLLPGWYDEWILFEQDRYREVRLHALEALCVRLVEVGRTPFAVEVGLAAVAGDPLRESAQQALMNAYLAAGNRAAAVREFERFRTMLRRELGLEPSASLAGMIRQAVLG
ncbi:MAG TPA: BTAD domain-containing putative transcriptional regulator [Candidatus Dormibacteraeota bacterium]